MSSNEEEVVQQTTEVSNEGATGEVVATAVAEEAVPTGIAPETPIVDSKKPKKKRGVGFKILMVVIGIFVVLVAGVGVGYGVFHDTPGFCNFICHTPMDPYVASYQDNVSINPLQTDTSATLGVTVHKNADDPITCLDCHQDGINEQIQEGLAWVSGNYTIPLEIKLLSKDPKEGSNSKNGNVFCLREGCHEGVTTPDELKAVFAGEHRNVHDNHNANLDCGICHQMHEQSVLYCSSCHADVALPDGWLKRQDYEAMQSAG